MTSLVIVAPLVLELSVTDWVVVNVPPAGLNVGAADHELAVLER